MLSSNLSKLTLSSYFFELLDNENIAFDHIISDYYYADSHQNILLLDQPFSSFTQNYGIQKSDHILVILSKLSSKLLVHELSEYPHVSIINLFDGIASLGRKVCPEFDSLNPALQSGFELFFPFDERYFLSVLKTKSKNYLSIHNQEIAESIYILPEDEELAVIDKALAENPDMISLIHNPDAENLILAMGSYFEELVKLSSLLLTAPEAYHLVAIARWSKLQDPVLLKHAKKAKKLIIILDQYPSHDLIQELSNILGVWAGQLTLLTPHYDQLTSIQAEYQLEQCWFDAEALFQQINN